jgi:hypothetical protein
MIPERAFRLLSAPVYRFLATCHDSLAHYYRARLRRVTESE